MTGVRPYALFLAALCLTGSLGSGERSQCHLDNPGDQLKVCVQNVLDRITDNVTEWLNPIRGSPISLPKRHRDKGHVAHYYLHTISLEGSNSIVIDKLTVQDISSSDVSILLSGHWQRLVLTMDVICVYRGESRGRKIKVNIQGTSNTSFTGTTASLAATWKIADIRGTPPVGPSDTEVTIRIESPKTKLKLNGETSFQDAKPTGKRDNIANVNVLRKGKSYFRGQIAEEWKNNMQTVIEEQLKNDLKKTLSEKVGPKLCKELAEQLV